MKKFFHNIKKYYRYAVRSAKAELKSEVADSYLNWLWWIIEPLCFMMIYVFIFTVVFKNTTPYFASFVFAGQMAWDFFNRMISGSVKLITSNRDLVTKVYIPKYILLLSKSFTYLFKMGISFIITLIIMACQHVPFTWHLVFVIPIVIVLYIISFGLGLLLMHVGVFFDDLSKLTNIFLRMLFYLSGIFYDIRRRLKSHPKLVFFMIRANPVAFVMDEFRKVMISNQMPSFEGLLFWCVMGILFTIVGVRTIHKNENSYAKVI